MLPAFQFFLSGSKSAQRFKFTRGFNHAMPMTPGKPRQPNAANGGAQLKPLSNRTTGFLSRLKFAPIGKHEHAEAVRARIRNISDTISVEDARTEMERIKARALSGIRGQNPAINLRSTRALLLTAFFSKNLEVRAWAFIYLGEVGEAWRKAVFKGIPKDQWRKIEPQHLSPHERRNQEQLENLLHDIRAVSLQMSGDKRVDSAARHAFARIKGTPGEIDLLLDEFHLRERLDLR